MESLKPASPTTPQLYFRLLEIPRVVVKHSPSSSSSSIAHDVTKLERRRDDGSSVSSSGAIDVL
jgi:hypothetical protein